MRESRFSILVVVLLSALLVSPAALWARRKGKARMKLVTAYHKEIGEADQSNPPNAGYFFVVVWKHDSYPETVFWRGQGGWLTCSVERAHGQKTSSGKNWSGEFVNADMVKKGDTLMLTPLTGGRFPVPGEIPEDARNTIFYKTGGSAWIGFRVKKIHER